MSRVACVLPCIANLSRELSHALQVPGLDAWRVSQLSGQWLQLEQVLLICKPSICAAGLGRPRAQRLAAATASDLAAILDTITAQPVSASVTAPGSSTACLAYVIDIVGSMSLADVPALREGIQQRALTASGSRTGALRTLTVNLTLSGVTDEDGILPVLDMASMHDAFAVRSSSGTGASVVQLVGLRVINLAAAVPGMWTFPLWAWQFNRSSGASSSALQLQDVSASVYCDGELMHQLGAIATLGSI